MRGIAPLLLRVTHRLTTQVGLDPVHLICVGESIPQSMYNSSIRNGL